MRKRVIAIAAGCLLLGGGSVWAGYQGREVKDGGSIRGVVRVTGEVPVLPAQPVYKHAEVCGAGVPDERLLSGAGGVLQNAVVSLDGITSGKPPPGEPLLLDNVKCTFVPHVLAGTVGQRLDIRNSDPFLHDAHAWLGTRTLFNVGLPKGRTVSRTLEVPGLAHINCNVRHTWMHAYLFVSENPYHAVTAADGSFAIGDVPPGTHTVTIWHEMLGSLERQVTVEAGKASTLDVGMPASALDVSEPAH